MSLLQHSLLGLALVLGTSAWAGCATTADDAESDEAAITSSSCQIFNNQTGKPITPAELAKLNDPVAKKLLEGSNCPTSYTTALAKLKTNDSKDCKDVQGGAQAEGLGSFLISETAAFSDDSSAARDGYRTVITKTCDGRKNDELIFSASASAAGASDSSIEMIGKDATTGVFNYYEVLRGGQWVYYGDSADFIGNGYDCKDSGVCVSTNSAKNSSPSKKSCASCHISGGLIMKELDSPWLHWTAGHPKGSEGVVKKSSDKLGNQMQGENLEISVVRPSFDSYNQKRVDILAKKGLAELVRPLFCTMDINLDSQNVGTSLMVDTAVARSFTPGDQAAYKELKAEVKQRISGLPASVTDTSSPFTYPTRGAIDVSYGSALTRAKLVDAELMQDILNVDFTRPIFSGARCGLVNAIQGKTGAVDAKLATFAKETDKAKRDTLAADIAKDIPAVFRDALKAKGSRTAAEERFLTNLTDAKETAAAHQAAANAFLAKCGERLKGTDKKAALKDMMTFASHQRTVMRRDVIGKNKQDLLEGGGDDNKMVTDDIKDNANALDPVTCELTLAAK